MITAKPEHNRFPQLTIIVGLAAVGVVWREILSCGNSSLSSNFTVSRTLEQYPADDEVC